MKGGGPDLPERGRDKGKGESLTRLEGVKKGKLSRAEKRN